jgi:hypothetical protein
MDLNGGELKDVILHVGEEILNLFKAMTKLLKDGVMRMQIWLFAFIQ